MDALFFGQAIYPLLSLLLLAEDQSDDRENDDVAMLLLYYGLICRAVLVLHRDIVQQRVALHERIAVLAAERLQTSFDSNRWRTKRNRLEREARGGPPNKKKKCRLNKARGQANVTEDYWCDDPTFDDNQFIRMFGLSRDKAKLVIDACLRQEPDVFHQTGHSDALGQKGHPAFVKVLCVLKICRFGTPICAFRDYFQMSEEDTRKSFHAVFRAVAADEGLQEVYRRTMSQEDACRVSKMHKKKFGVAGMVFSIDCMHFSWKNCPAQFKGQFVGGKSKGATVVLEAGADTNGWFWHSTFGYPGGQNDIIVWDRSPLNLMLTDGTWSKQVDPVEPFTIGGVPFTKLWFLVDGIYPKLERFAKTISVPIGEEEKRYVQWQEGARKDVERAFGILQRKWRIVKQPCELRNIEDIRNMLLGLIVFHNMMVKDRVELGEDDDSSLYALDECLGAQLRQELIVGGGARKEEGQEKVLQRVLDSLAQDAVGGANLNQALSPEAKELFRQQMELHRFETLNDPVQHARLQAAIMKELASRSRHY